MSNHEELGKNPEGIATLNKYDWEGINFPSEKDNWKKTEKNNITIVLDVLYAIKEKIYPTYVSKQPKS